MNEEVSTMGYDLTLAPFGAGRRVCPGKAMDLAFVHLWLAQLLHNFKWVPFDDSPVDLDECLMLSVEMKKPLLCKKFGYGSCGDFVWDVVEDLKLIFWVFIL
ncbi:putative cytochrome P450 [Medicago truncatula]|uniref:Putative cytochrome P450 n=1 Tax=Medicago truncatula TaxID=3880 RepID=A0A396IS72_MEDTR|nr:putative cytochrome P450 [Medicago truncatula]